MSVSPEHFLTGAKEIAGYSLEEIHQRSAISRGYYWAYHSAKSVVQSDRKDRGLGMHRSYIAQLNEHKPGSFERKLGTKLNSMYGRRLKADYELAENITSKDWEMLLETANEMREILDNPPQPPAKPILRVIK